MIFHCGSALHFPGGKPFHIPVGTHGGKLYDIDLGNDFLERTLKHRQQRQK